MAQTARVREVIATTRIARHELGLGLDQPVHDLLLIVEKTADVPVAILPLGNGVAGAYIVRRDHAFIFLNASEAVTRQCFTLAHELGHQRLGHRVVVDGTETVEGRIASRVGDPVQTQSGTPPYQAPDANLTRWNVTTDRFAVSRRPGSAALGRRRNQRPEERSSRSERRSSPEFFEGGVRFESRETVRQRRRDGSRAAKDPSRSLIRFAARAAAPSRC